MAQALRILIEHVHDRVKFVATKINEKILVPLILVFVYFIGLGFTRVFSIFFDHPLLKNKSSDSYWRDIQIGFDPNSPDKLPDEDRYLRQS